MREQAFVVFRDVRDASAAMRAEQGREFFGMALVRFDFSLVLCWGRVGNGKGGREGGGGVWAGREGRKEGARWGMWGRVMRGRERYTWDGDMRCRGLI